MVKVWVLDLVGYDARGGNAKVFATLEAAKASVDWVKKWEQQDDGSWMDVRRPGSTEDFWTIEEQTVGE